MSGLPVELSYAHDPTGEVTPADRDDLSNRLNGAFAAGDIDMENYQTRLNALFQATKRGELVPVMQGLPAQYSTSLPVLGGDQPARPGELEPIGPAPKGLVLAGVGAGILMVVLIVLVAILL